MAKLGAKTVCIHAAVLACAFTCLTVHASDNQRCSVTIAALLELPDWDTLTIQPETVIKECTVIINASESVAVDRATIYRKRGEALLHLGRNQEALEDFEKYLAHNPNNKHVLLYKACALYALEKTDQARTSLSELIKQHPTFSKPLVMAAALQVSGGNWDEAIAFCTKAIALDNNSCLAYLNRAQAYYFKGEYRKCIEDLDKAVLIEPLQGRHDSDFPYLLRGKAYRLIGQHESAVRNIHMARHLNPDSFDCALELWQSYYEMGKINLCVAFSHELRTLGKEKVKSLLASYVSYFAINDYDRAFQMIEKAGLQQHNDPNVYIALGNACVSLGRRPEALVFFDKGLLLFPNHPALLCGKASLLIDLPEKQPQHYQLAIKLALEACKVTKNTNIECLRVLARSYTVTGDYDQAIRTIETCIKLVEKGSSLEMELTNDLAIVRQERNKNR